MRNVCAGARFRYFTRPTPRVFTSTILFKRVSISDMYNIICNLRSEKCLGFMHYQISMTIIVSLYSHQSRVWKYCCVTKFDDTSENGMKLNAMSFEGACRIG